MGIDIAFVPLLAAPHNAARSPVKYFDWAWLGVPGVYSNTTPYNNVVKDRITGLLVGDSGQEWRRALHNLLHDQDLRREIVTESQLDLTKRSLTIPFSRYREILFGSRDSRESAQFMMSSHDFHPAMRERLANYQVVGTAATLSAVSIEHGVALHSLRSAEGSRDIAADIYEPTVTLLSNR
jgi:hypothetical protein